VAVIESIEPNPAHQGEEIAFIGKGIDSDGSIVAYRWSIAGDGAIAFTDSFVSPTAAKEAGTYTVVFKVQDSDGVWSPEVSRTLEVTPRYTISPPSPDFAASPTSGSPPLTVRFTDLSTGTITSWHWNFGDGTSSSAQNSSHTYIDPGTYTVTLLVIGPAGRNSKTIHGYIQVGTSLAADFQCPSTAYVGLGVLFRDLSTGDITSWLWNFGDGSISTDQNPVHTFSGEGIYEMMLTVSGPRGTDTTTCTVEVRSL